MEINILDNISSITVTGLTGLSAGGGADGGTGGNGGNGGGGGRGGQDSATSDGSTFGYGGHGAAGGAAGDVKVTVRTTKQVTYADAVSLTAGLAGNGAIGGNGGDNSQTAFNNLANQGASGVGGSGGVGGAGGAGGKGGSVKIETQTLEFNNNVGHQHIFTVESGDGGLNGLNQALNASTGNTFGLGGAGGDAEVLVHDNIDFNENTVMNFTKGASTAATALGGVLDVQVSKSVNVGAGKTVNLAITNGGQLVNTVDEIYFNTMELQFESTFGTANVLGGVGDVGLGGVEYSVQNLYVHHNAAWATNGVYLAAGGWSTYDLTDVKLNNSHRMLDLKETDNTVTGYMDLSNFDLVKQQFDFNNKVHDHAFMETEYQLKAHHLGTITLANRVDASSLATDTNFWGNSLVNAGGSYNDQHRVNDFALDGGLRRYFWDVHIANDGTNDTLRAYNFYTADGYKTYLQGYLSGVQSLNQTFWSSTEPLLRGAAEGPLDTTVLKVKLGGSSTETNTGSDIDVDNFSASLALSRKVSNDAGATTVAAFLEYGNGSYDTYASIYRLGKLYGDGDTKHFGGGLFLRHDFEQGTYLEASLRGGSVDTDYKLRKDTRFASPYSHSWDSSSNYFGAHFGLGQQFNLNDQTMLDVYGKLLWTQTDGDTVRTRYEKFHADDVESLRSRLGVRLNHSSESGLFKGYLGLAWEHEYDGEASGYISGPGVPKERIRKAPDLGGSSGFAEAGFSYRPTQDAKYTIDMGVFGLAGEQDGFGGTLGLKFEF